MGVEELTDQESVYFCMACRKIYDENPGTCSGGDGKVHSKFVDMAKFLGKCPQVRSYEPWKSILRFDIGQVENLDFVMPMGNIALDDLLSAHGFGTIARIRNREKGRELSREEVEKLALSTALCLNSNGIKYFVFSSSYRGEFLGYTFMKR